MDATLVRSKSRLDYAACESLSSRNRHIRTRAGHSQWRPFASGGGIEIDFHRRRNVSVQDGLCQHQWEVSVYLWLRGSPHLCSGGGCANCKLAAILVKRPELAC